MAKPEDLKVGDFVSWNSSGGRARGKITKKITDGSRVPDIEPDIIGTKDDPAYQIRVYRDNEPTDTLVGHKAGALTKIDPIESDKSLDELDPEEIALREEDNKERDEVYKKYHDTVNMSASELESWSENECSKKASVSRAPIKRNLELLRTKKEDWTTKHIRWANRTISFVNRMKGNDAGEPAADGCPSKKTISLKNWAFDPGKGSNKSMENMDAIAQQLAEQKDAIEELRQAVQNALNTHLNVELSADTEGGEDDDDQLDYRMGTPSDRQLAQINKVLGRESSADDWFVCAFHASNVLLDLDLRAWDESAIYQMALDAVGRPILLNHAWGSIESSQGFIYQALLVKDTEVDPSMLEGAGHEDYNKEIIEENGGLLWLYLAACMPKNSEAAEAIANRKYVDSSTGTILHSPVFICPDCTRDHRKAHPGSKESISFSDYIINERGKREALCPHLIPSRFMFSWFDPDEIAEMNFARYAVLTSATTSKFVENSLCVQGCLPKAGVLTDNKK